MDRITLYDSQQAVVAPVGICRVHLSSTLLFDHVFREITRCNMMRIRSLCFTALYRLFFGKQKKRFL